MKSLTKYFSLILAGSLLASTQHTAASLYLAQYLEQQCIEKKARQLLIEQAVNRGKLELLSECKNNELKVIDSKRQSLLHLAAKSKAPNAPQIIEYLVKERGLDIHRRDNKGNKPIMNAQTVEALKTFLALENAATFTKETTLFSNLIETTNTAGESLLHKAVKRGNVELVNYLLKMGPLRLVNKQNCAGETPLFYLNGTTAYSGITIAKLLIEKGAFVNAKNKFGDTVLVKLVRKIKTLDPKIKSNQLRIKLLLHLIDFLFINGADLNSENNNHETLIQELKLPGTYSKRLITFLFERGLNLEHPVSYKNKQFPLLLSSISRGKKQGSKIDAQTAKLLIKLGVNWDSTISKTHLLNFFNFTQEGSKKLFTYLLPTIITKLTGHKVKLPLIEPASPILLNAFVNILKYGYALPRKVKQNTLEHVCLLFINALNKDIPSEQLKLTDQEKMFCKRCFTMTPHDFREHVFSQEKQKAYFNSAIKSQSKNLTGFTPKMLQDLHINFKK